MRRAARLARHSPGAAILAQLSAPYHVRPDQREEFTVQGFVRLKHVLSAECLAYFERIISEAVARLHDPEGQRPPNSSDDLYARAFWQVMNLWARDERVRPFTLSTRLARIAAALMGVRGVRLYHDQALYKEARGGPTPWHCDQYYWPLDTLHTCTVWVPLQETPLEMGPMRFAAGSHALDLGRDLFIGEESERLIPERIAARGLEVVSAPFALGEVSYHAGWTFHSAPANTTDRPRRAMTVIYMADDARLVEPQHDNHRCDRDAWLPGVGVGEVCAGPLNPRVYRRRGSAA